MPKTSTIVAFLALFLAACGATETHRVITGQPRAQYTGNIRIHMEGQGQPADFREIAIVQAKCTGSHADLEHVIAGLRQQAAWVGCDTIVRIHFDQGASHASGTGVCGIATGE